MKKVIIIHLIISLIIIFVNRFEKYGMNFKLTCISTIWNEKRVVLATAVRSDDVVPAAGMRFRAEDHISAAALLSAAVLGKAIRKPEQYFRNVMCECRKILSRILPGIFLGIFSGISWEAVREAFWETRRWNARLTYPEIRHSTELRAILLADGS